MSCNLVSSKLICLFITTAAMNASCAANGGTTAFENGSEALQSGSSSWEFNGDMETPSLYTLSASSQNDIKARIESGTEADVALVESALQNPDVAILLALVYEDYMRNGHQGTVKGVPQQITAPGGCPPYGSTRTIDAYGPSTNQTHKYLLRTPNPNISGPAQIITEVTRTFAQTWSYFRCGQGSEIQNILGKFFNDDGEECWAKLTRVILYEGKPASDDLMTLGAGADDIHCGDGAYAAIVAHYIDSHHALLPPDSTPPPPAAPALSVPNANYNHLPQLDLLDENWIFGAALLVWALNGGGSGNRPLAY